MHSWHTSRGRFQAFSEVAIALLWRELPSLRPLFSVCLPMSLPLKFNVPPHMATRGAWHPRSYPSSSKLPAFVLFYHPFGIRCALSSELDITVLCPAQHTLRGLVIVEPKDGDNLKDKREHATEARALKCLLPDLPSQMSGLPVSVRAQAFHLLLAQIPA